MASRKDALSNHSNEIADTETGHDYSPRLNRKIEDDETSETSSDILENVVFAGVRPPDKKDQTEFCKELTQKLEETNRKLEEERIKREELERKQAEKDKEMTRILEEERRLRLALEMKIEKQRLQYEKEKEENERRFSYIMQKLEGRRSSSPEQVFFHDTLTSPLRSSQIESKLSGTKTAPVMNQELIPDTRSNRSASPQRVASQLLSGIIQPNGTGGSGVTVPEQMQRREP